MKPFLTVFFSLLASLSFAQQALNVYYLKNNGRFLNTADSADYIRVITAPNDGSKLFNVTELYPTKQPKLIFKTKNPNFFYLEDQSISFYPNGRKKLIANYKDNLLDGMAYYYYPNGNNFMVIKYTTKDSVEKKHHIKTTDSIMTAAYDSSGKAMVENGNGYFINYASDHKTILEEGQVKNGKRIGRWKGKDVDHNYTFEEEYADGKLIKGISTDGSGNTYNYTQRIEPAQFKGGLDGFGKFLGTTIRYPQLARENNIQGMVLVQFTVKPDGTTGNPIIVSHVSPDLDTEVLRVLELMPKWQPCKQYGKPEAMFYTTPVNFTLDSRMISR